LRIFLVGDDNNVRQQRAKFCRFRISMRPRKKADPQDSGLVYDHCNGVALSMSRISVLTRSDRDRRSRTFAEAQPGNHDDGRCAFGNSTRYGFGLALSPQTPSSPES
jgi:hypothetical protein